LTIKRLITHGCSFAYGEELGDPSSSSWPALVAEHLKVDLVNLAKPAYNNDSIVFDLIATDLNREHYDDLVIVGWTSYLRLEFIDDEGWFSTLSNYKQAGHRQEISDVILKYANDKWLYRRWLTQVILLQEYLKSKHIKYLFFNVFDTQKKNIEYKNVSQFKTLFDKIDKRLFVGWPDQGMVEWAYSSPVGPRGHPLELGHEKTADYLLKSLRTIYDLG
jgi:hypothetical protein